MARLTRMVPPLPQTERGASCAISTDALGERLLYCNGSNVLWRAIAPLAEGKGGEKPEDIFCFRGHARRTTCAAMGPNSQWVASGDVGGAIRVWGAKGDHVLKNEYKLWDGTVKDVSWSMDSTRIVASGDGKETRAVAMIWDTGSKTGEISGHTKQVNSVSFRSQRPFRVVTGGEDMLVAFHHGPPFKFARSHVVHTNFVNSVRYSPDGAHVISAGSDSKLCLYDGQEGELKMEFAKPEGISGSLWASAWSPDSTRVVTAGGDKRLRIWDCAAGSQVAEAQVGSGELDDMQIGVTWPNIGRIISVCLDGRIILWDVAADSNLLLAATIDGTQASLCCLAYDWTTGALLQGGADGFLAASLQDKPTWKAKIGKGITHIVAHSPGYSGPSDAWVFSLDDCARQLSLETGDFVGEPVEIKEFVVGVSWMDAQETKLVCATSKQALLCLGVGGVEWRKNAAFPRRPTVLATLPSASYMAVALDRPEQTIGGVQSSQFDIQLFNVSDANAAEGSVLQATLEGHIKEVSALRFAPSGEFLASADAGNKILVWTLTGERPEKVVTSEWCLHTARINCLDWLPGGRRLISGSLDRHIYVWDIDATKTKVHVPEAHKGGVTAIVACGERSFASVGHDGFLLVHELE